MYFYRKKRVYRVSRTNFPGKITPSYKMFYVKTSILLKMLDVHRTLLIDLCWFRSLTVQPVFNIVQLSIWLCKQIKTRQSNSINHDYMASVKHQCRTTTSKNFREIFNIPAPTATTTLSSLLIDWHITFRAPPNSLHCWPEISHFQVFLNLVSNG